MEGKELKVRLDKDGVLGVFEDLSGKEVEFVSFASQDTDATVIIPSQQESKIVGKISRRVSFVLFSKPDHLLEATNVKTQQKLVRAVTSSLKNSNPAQSSQRKSGLSVCSSTFSFHPQQQREEFQVFKKKAFRALLEQTKGLMLSRSIR